MADYMWFHCFFVLCLYLSVYISSHIYIEHRQSPILCLIFHLAEHTWVILYWKFFYRLTDIRTVWCLSRTLCFMRKKPWNKFILSIFLISFIEIHLLLKRKKHIPMTLAVRLLKPITIVAYIPSFLFHYHQVASRQRTGKKFFLPLCTRTVSSIWHALISSWLTHDLFYVIIAWL
jgi:hypothetical protein